MILLLLLPTGGTVACGRLPGWRWGWTTGCYMGDRNLENDTHQDLPLYSGRGWANASSVDSVQRTAADMGRYAAAAAAAKSVVTLLLQEPRHTLTRCAAPP